MKFFKTLIAVLCMYNSYAQTNDTEIKQIQNYIQIISEDEWFDPINKNGTLANNNTYDVAYYVLPDNKIFQLFTPFLMNIHYKRFFITKTTN